MITPEKLKKIRALAEDIRGDPATREVAHRIYARYSKEPLEPPPKPKPFYDNRVPGMKPSPEHERYIFMDLGQWKKTVNSNISHMILHKEILWRIVLFRHKNTSAWHWLRINTMTKQSEFSRRFATLAEAHEDAWTSLMAI